MESLIGTADSGRIFGYGEPGKLSGQGAKLLECCCDPRATKSPFPFLSKRMRAVLPQSGACCCSKEKQFQADPGSPLHSRIDVTTRWRRFRYRTSSEQRCRLRRTGSSDSAAKGVPCWSAVRVGR